MKYRMKVANLSRGMDLERVQSDLNELEKVYQESEPFLGKVTEEKKSNMFKSIAYVRGLVDVNIEFRNDHLARQSQQPSDLLLRIA